MSAPGAGAVAVWPIADLRIRGRANHVGFNRAYPEGWSIEILSVVEQGSVAVTEVRVPHPTVGPLSRDVVLRGRGGPCRQGARILGPEEAEEPPPEGMRFFEAR